MQPQEEDNAASTNPLGLRATLTPRQLNREFAQLPYAPTQGAPRTGFDCNLGTGTAARVTWLDDVSATAAHVPTIRERTSQADLNPPNVANAADEHTGMVSYVPPPTEPVLHGSTFHAEPTDRNHQGGFEFQPPVATTEPTFQPTEEVNSLVRSQFYFPPGLTIPGKGCLMNLQEMRPIRILDQLSALPHLGVWTVLSEKYHDCQTMTFDNVCPMECLWLTSFRDHVVSPELVQYVFPYEETGAARFASEIDAYLSTDGKEFRLQLGHLHQFLSRIKNQNGAEKEVFNAQIDDLLGNCKQLLQAFVRLTPEEKNFMDLQVQRVANVAASYYMN